MYKYKTVVRMHLTDALGITYFASFFVLAHECYESFFEQYNSLGSILEQKEFIIPIVHAEADYRTPLKLSEKITVEMTLSKTANTSFEFSFNIINESSQVSAEIKMVHAVLCQSTRKPVKIPPFLKTILSRL